MNAIITLLSIHGFDGFVNIDNETVSFYLEDSHGAETLITVNSLYSAQTAIGY